MFIVRRYPFRNRFTVNFLAKLEKIKVRTFLW